MRWTSRSPAKTRAAGRALASAFDEAGAVVVLTGPLGAGKTVFAKGVAEGLGLAGDALASPTFVLASELETPGGLRLVHADLYRVESLGELEAAGWWDWLAPGTVVLVEWGERLPEALPPDRLELRLSGPTPDGGARSGEARARGAGAEAVLRRFEEALAAGAALAGATR